MQTRFLSWLVLLWSFECAPLRAWLIRFGRVVPFAWLLLLGSACSLTMSDLLWSNPKGRPVYICDKPLDVPDDVDLWALQSVSGRIVTGEDPAELRFFAHQADIFFKYDRDAPLSSLEWAPREWGLTCKKPVTILSDPEAILPREKRCEGKIVPNVLLGQTVQKTTPRDPPIQAQKPPDPVRVPVCVRPPGIPADAKQWAAIKGATGARFTRDEEEYAKEVANAAIIFIFDENAPPESVYYFVTDAKKLRCPGKPLPKPLQEIVGSGSMPLLGQMVANGAKAAKGDPKKGSSETTTTSSPDGKGPALDFLEQVTRELVIAGALSAGDTSGSLKDPNGSRYGIPSGKNVGGPDLQVLQAAVGTFNLSTAVYSIVKIPAKSGREFIDKVKRAMKRGKVAVILDPDVLSKEIAEELAKDVEGAIGGKVMAESLQKAGVIMPYSRASIFTRDWLRDFQAHHILEVNMFERLGKGEMAKDGPAVILSKADHDLITRELTKARNDMLDNVKKAGRDLQPADVWQMYQKVYANYPNWRKAIEHYFK